MEIVIGTALVLFAVTGLFGAYSFYLRVGLKQSDALSVAFLAEEGVEATLLLRDEGWNNISSLIPGTPYFLFWNGANWTATTTPVVIGGIFQRTVLTEDVYRRNADKDIVASTSPDAKTVDPDTKRLKVRVNNNGAETELITYIANLFE